MSTSATDRKRACDLAIVGGGIAGSSLAIVMARLGFDVVVLEKERQFRDRVRGEVIYPWGVAEVTRLGLYADFTQGCGRVIEFDTDHIGGVTLQPMRYKDVSPDKVSALSFPHPQMQEKLLTRAIEAGVEVHRGAVLGDIRPGNTPELDFHVDGEERSLSARLIVGADGRESRVLQKLKFTQERDPEKLYTAGVQLRGFSENPSSVHFFLDDAEGFGSVVIETAPCNHRAYLLYHKDALPHRPSGTRDYELVMDRFRKLGFPDTWLEQAEPHGILASFDGAHRWVNRASNGGVTLIGDAAGSSDPVWGNGLSRSLRSVRLLRDRLLSDNNWATAAEAYAEDHLKDFLNLRRLERTMAELNFSMGADALARRNRAWKLIEKEPELAIRISLYGPDRQISDYDLSRLLN
jgi:2-polyprenyl-6-methoxyphenol hydroxylase-like FAD-dependent oxidoreductase